MTYGSIAQAAVGTAVIADTASTVHHVQNQNWSKQEADAQAQYKHAYQQLVDFYNRGLLAEEEFTAAMQKLITG